MIRQIKIDNNNVVELCSIGGIVEGGINVEDIPDKVILCPSKWKFENGKFLANEAYIEPAEEEELTLDDLALAVAELAEMVCGGE